jgi:PHS family inorganic phosphate transporter-like MFS transporter
MDVERNVRCAAEDIGEVARGVEPPLDDELIIRRVDVPKVSWADFRAHFGQWKNMEVLIGTFLSWFALDVSLLCICDLFTIFSVHL